jgi:transcriptional regulator with XRE-family HTH domain
VNRFRTALAKNLKRARSEQGLTQQDLAERCELSTNYLATVEIGGKFPSADTLEKLAVALGLKPYQLFLEEGDVEAFDRTELVARYRDRAEGYLVEALVRAARELTLSSGTPRPATRGAKRPKKR